MERRRSCQMKSTLGPFILSTITAPNTITSAWCIFRCLKCGSLKKKRSIGPNVKKRVVAYFKALSRHARGQTE